MSVTTRIEPLDRDIAALVSADLSSSAQRRALAGFAREMLSEAQETNKQALGHVPRHDTYVDGRKGAALETVRPQGGTIVFEFELFSDLFQFIDAMLTLHSPYRTGRYARSHVFLAGETEADPFGEVPLAASYTFVNLQPYARRVEKRQAVYEVVADMARRRFGKLAEIRFQYRQAPATALSGRKSRRATADLRNPSLQITPR